MAKKQTNPAPERGKPPVAKLCKGLPNASIWAHVSDTGTFYSVTFERRHRDANNEWKSTQIFDRSSLVRLAKLADEADTEIARLTAMEAAQLGGFPILQCVCHCLSVCAFGQDLDLNVC